MKSSEKDSIKREDMIRAFELAEANSRLENADPSGDPLYESIKLRMINGDLTVEQAREEITSFHRRKN